MSIFLRRVLNKLRPVSLDEASVSTRILAPASEHTPRASFYLPGEFDAVIECVNDDREKEWLRVSGATLQNLPTIEYTLANARLKRDFLYSGRYLERFHADFPLEEGAKSDVIDHMDDAILSTNCLSGIQFGHWLRDSLVTELHGSETGLRSVALARKPWSQEPEFRKLAGLVCAYPARCSVDRLVVLDDRGHNQYWKARFLALRARMKAASSTDPAAASAGPLVFLSRGANAQLREPTNVEAIQLALRDLGFRSINPSAMSVQEVADALRDARIVVGTEGSNLNHIHCFAPDGVALVCLQDPRRFYAYHKSMMDGYDGRFGFIVGRPDMDAPGRHKVDIDRLKATIDLVD